VRRLPLVEIAVAVALVVAAIAVWPRHRPALSVARASWTMTPGVINPDVTQRTLATTICRSGFTHTIRPPHEYTDDLKRKQLREYGFAGSTSQFQEDHLISLELGGHPTDPRNLWPERRPRAEEVDRIENELNAQICSGRISLQEGRKRISEIKHTQG
jgi:hypothetical protein